MRLQLRPTPRPRPAGFNAGELAYALLGVCELGLRVRALGACLGSGLRRRVTFTFDGGGQYARHSPGSQVLRVREHCPAGRREASAAVFRAVRHARAGHDAHCAIVGVSANELAAIANAWATVDVAAFVLEAFHQAVPELTGEIGNEAMISLTHVVSVHVTPRVPSRGALQAAALRARVYAGR